MNAMVFVTTMELLKKAYSGGYAIGAFNVINLEIHLRISIPSFSIASLDSILSIIASALSIALALYQVLHKKK